MKGESALETLKRETMEELGVELNVKNAIKIKKNFFIISPNIII